VCPVVAFFYRKDRQGLRKVRKASMSLLNINDNSFLLKASHSTITKLALGSRAVFVVFGKINLKKKEHRDYFV
jgi:hypothetical protein